MQSATKFQTIARAGYAARAAVFFLVGGLALFSGLSTGKSDTKSALDALLEQPFGRLWVGLIALGLAGFVIWRLSQSILNADNQRSDVKGAAIRVALFGSAIAYGGLAYYAFDHALGLGSQENGGSQRGLAEWVMAQPFGRYLAGAIGIGFVGGGCVTIAKGILRKYERYLDEEARGRKSLTVACVYGLASRGVLFVIVGCFLLYAAISVAPQHAGSMVDALNWIRGLPFGGMLYSVVAFGLVSFGVYNLIEAKYRIVRAPNVRASIQNATEGAKL